MATRNVTRVGATKESTIAASMRKAIGTSQPYVSRVRATKESTISASMRKVIGTSQPNACD